jgi:hypothetical protein
MLPRDSQDFGSCFGAGRRSMIPPLALAHQRGVTKKAAAECFLDSGTGYGVRGRIRMLSAEFEDLFDGR